MWAPWCRGIWCSHPGVLWLCQCQHHTAVMFEPTVLLLVRRIPPHFFNYHPKPHTHSPTTSISAPQSHLRAQDYASRQAPPPPSSPQQLPAPGPRRLRGEEPGPGGAARGRERRRDPEQHRDGTGTGSGARGTRSRTPTPASAPRGAPVSAGAGPRGRRVLGLPPSLPPPRPLCGAVPGPGSPR